MDFHPYGSHMWGFKKEIYPVYATDVIKQDPKSRRIKSD